MTAATTVVSKTKNKKKNIKKQQQSQKVAKIIIANIIMIALKMKGICEKPRQIRKEFSVK